MNPTQATESDLSRAAPITLIDVFQVLVDHSRLLILAPIGAAAIALGLSYLVTPSFTASAQILPPQQQQSAAASMLQSLGALSGIAGAASAIKNPADQYVAFLKTTSIADALVDRFALMERYDVQLRYEARKVLQKKSHIASSNDGIISIEVDDRNPQFAAQLANGYIEELARLMNRLAVTEAQQRRLFFEKQLAQTKERLTKAEQTLAASGVSVGALNATPSAALEGPARLRAEMTALEVKIASLRSYLTESAPEIQAAQSSLAALREQLAAVQAQKPEDGGRSSHDDYIANYREFKYQQTLFEMFAKQYEMARVDESREGAVVQVIDTAQPPERKSSPKRLLIAIGVGALTTLLLMAGLFLRESVRRSQQDAETAEKMARLQRSFRNALRLRPRP